MIRAAIIGFGNIGRYVLDTLNESPDFTVAGIVSRSLAPNAVAGVQIAREFSELSDVQVAILCAPSRNVPAMAEALLKSGIRTVDSFDIHSEISQTAARLDAVAKEHQTAAVISAGWDPGTDSIIRTLAEAMIPKGITYTNFGPGMSMGHSTAVKAVAGVKDALSVTIPKGTGLHRRMVYIELEKGADFETVTNAIKQDPYFIHDETHVTAVASVDEVRDMGHGVALTRKGASGSTHNQNIAFTMSINNPALTAQILVSAARAVTKRQPGCYTMIEIPVVDFLPGDKADWIKKLV